MRNLHRYAVEEEGVEELEGVLLTHWHGGGLCTSGIQFTHSCVCVELQSFSA
jgi:hypothetical protein